jgi:hypothetical protein
VSYYPSQQPQPPKRPGVWAGWVIGAAVVVAVALLLAGILAIAFVYDRLSGLV